ncbi:VanZ family protein [Microbacterium sp. ARD32]|uniref:VanZ family protein n=1 Tax=Microbacterium sp. ARD32 TaxID=2962577 RepID=UPI0028826796|nr:VanZ family protein [Microbacterium sp. ARD32]MDT0156392.1 VanZ family protein [Microbacterium sp. ARD32]
MTDGATRRGRVIVVAALLLYAAGVLLLTLSPAPINLGHEEAIDKVVRTVRDDAGQGWFSYSKLELAANVALFAPLGLLLALALRRGLVWLGLLLLPAFSGCIELAQAVFLPDRTASVWDVVGNSLGGWAGLLAAVVLLALVRGRPVSARSYPERRRP